MTDTTKPNGDRDRPFDREAAKNPHGPAMGPPEGTASSGSTSPLDMALQRELAKAFGFYPATTNLRTSSATGDSTPPRMRLQHMDTATTLVTAVARPPATSSSP